MKREEGKVAFIGTTVNNFLFVCSRDDTWIKGQIHCSMRSIKTLKLNREIN
jgi:hypothetical protein